MIEHSVNNLNNFICGYYTDRIDICNKIIDAFNKSEKKSSGSVADYTDKNKRVIDLNIKNSNDLVLTSVGDSLFKEYVLELLQPCVQKYIERYVYCDCYSKWAIVDSPNIQHYPPNGGFYQWHTERGSSTMHNNIASRHLAFMTYLNDVTDDGETEFYYQKLKIKPELGLTLIWPVDWTFTHRGITSPTQDKMIVTGWFNYV